jgi:hypothetical protein
MNPDILAYLDAWTHDPRRVKPLFAALATAMAGCGASLELVVRQGITASLRASFPGPEAGPRPLFALADVVEDPQGRFLSVCFYDDEVGDPEERGQSVPRGLLNEDARCFDIDEPDPEILPYLAARLAEAADAWTQKKRP